MNVPAVSERLHRMPRQTPHRVLFVDLDKSPHLLVLRPICGDEDVTDHYDDGFWVRWARPEGKLRTYLERR